MVWGSGAPVKKDWLKKPSWGNAAPQPKWQPSQQTKPSGVQAAVPSGFEVQKDARYTGVVTSYFKWRGFGYIQLHQRGVVPGDQVFVHYRNIHTEDRYPRLYKGLHVEFGVMVWVEGQEKTRSVRAKSVTLPGGAPVNVQDEMDAQKSFVGGQHLRYTGLLKFYNPRDGFGWIKIDDGYAMDQPVPQEIKVEEQELNTGGRRSPKWLEEVNVEFGIFQNRKGHYQAYNVTLPGGSPLLQETLENRQVVSSQRYKGTITWYSWSQKWGHITPESYSHLPTRVLTKMNQMAEAAAQKSGKETPERVVYFRRRDCAWELKPEQGQQVTFQLYIDDKGAGACEVC